MVQSRDYKTEYVKSLRENIGRQIQVGQWFEVSQERITQFGHVTEDRQWIHMDVERSRVESPFGSTIAHGFLVLSLIPHLTGIGASTEDQAPGAKQMVNYGLNKVRFTHPVKAGDKIRSRKTLTDIIDKGDFVDVNFKVTIDIEGVEKPACVAESLARVFF